MLTTEQQDFYDQNGYLMVENVITKDQLNKLQTITYEFIEASRNIQENDDVFDLDEGHSAENPRLTRIKLPHKQNKYFDEILKNSGVTEVLRDLYRGEGDPEQSYSERQLYEMALDRFSREMVAVHDIGIEEAIKKTEDNLKAS